MKQTIIITLRTPGGQHIRDTRSVRLDELVQALSSYLSKGFEIIAIEELEGSVLDFYSKRLSADDIDAMASQVEQ